MFRVATAGSGTAARQIVALTMGPAPVGCMKTDYIPRTCGVLGLNPSDTIDYLMIGLRTPGRFVLNPYMESSGPGESVMVEVEGGTMKRSPYNAE